MIIKTPNLVQILLHFLIIIFVTLQLCHHTNPTSTNRVVTPCDETDIEYVQKSCNMTIYPKLCYQSLSPFACKIKTNPKTLAHVSLNVSLEAIKATYSMIKRVSKTRGLKPIDSAALRDCLELTDDSLEELENSIAEMSNIRSSDFAFQISNIQTWVSAVLTNFETCKDGFNESDMNKDVKRTVLRHVVEASHQVGIALALVNSYASANKNN